MTTLEMFRGDNKTINLRFTKGGVVQDITNWMIFFTAKRYISDTDAQAIMRKNNISMSDVLITNGSQGLATVSIFPADTSSLEYSELALTCDVQARDTSGKVSTTGFNLIVLPDVTRAA